MTDFDYQKDAQEKLAACGGSLSLKLSDTKNPDFIDEDDDTRYRPHYRCTLRGPGGSYTFDFWDSINAGVSGEPATVYAVLACLEWNTSDDFKDFCSECAYDTDSIKANKIWKACLKMTRALQRVFPSAEHQDILSQIR